MGKKVIFFDWDGTLSIENLCNILAKYRNQKEYNNLQPHNTKGKIYGKIGKEELIKYMGGEERLQNISNSMQKFEDNNIEMRVITHGYPKEVRAALCLLGLSKFISVVDGQKYYEEQKDGKDFSHGRVRG